MEMKTIAIMFVLMAFFTPLVHAGIEIKSYEISPSTLKPGMSGTIILTLNNPSSTEFIKDAYLDASANGIQFNVDNKIGDLGALGTTILAVPFKVESNAKPGVVSAQLSLGYTSSIGGGSNAKIFSIPITISATNLLKVTDFQVSKDTIYPGDSFNIYAVIENAGGAIRNSVLSYESSAAYTFDGTTKIDIGDIESGAKKSVTIPVLAGSEITSGYYAIPFTLTYDDAVIAGNTDTLKFGPITAVQDYEKFAISAETQDATPGGKGIFRIIIKNTGTNDLRNFRISLPQDATFFTSLDFPEKTLEVIKAGETKNVEFEVGIGTNIAAQVYSLKLALSYQTKSGSESIIKNVGVKIGGASELSVYLSSNPVVITNDNKLYSVSIQISNTGNSAIRALSIRANSDALQILNNPDSFIGTLSLDDYSTVQYDAIVKKGEAAGKYKFNVEITYKD